MLEKTGSYHFPRLENAMYVMALYITFSFVSIEAFTFEVFNGVYLDF